MKDVEARVNKLLTEAEDCDLIAKLAPILTSAIFIRNLLLISGLSLNV